MAHVITTRWINDKTSAQDSNKIFVTKLFSFHFCCFQCYRYTWCVQKSMSLAHHRLECNAFYLRLFSCDKIIRRSATKKMADEMSLSVNSEAHCMSPLPRFVYIFFFFLFCFQTQHKTDARHRSLCDCIFLHQFSLHPFVCESFRISFCASWMNCGVQLMVVCTLYMILYVSTRTTNITKNWKHKCTLQLCVHIKLSSCRAANELWTTSVWVFKLQFL